MPQFKVLDESLCAKSVIRIKDALPRGGLGPHREQPVKRQRPQKMAEQPAREQAVMAQAAAGHGEQLLQQRERRSSSLLSSALPGGRLVLLQRLLDDRLQQPRNRRLQ